MKPSDDTDVCDIVYDVYDADSAQLVHRCIQSDQALDLVTNCDKMLSVCVVSYVDASWLRRLIEIVKKLIRKITQIHRISALLDRNRTMRARNCLTSKACEKLQCSWP